MKWEKVIEHNPNKNGQKWRVSIKLWSFYNCEECELLNSIDPEETYPFYTHSRKKYKYHMKIHKIREKM
jgi:hypothetical protein